MIELFYLVPILSLFIFINNVHNIPINYSAIFLRFTGLSLFFFINPVIAYIINTTIFDAIDSAFYDRTLYPNYNDWIQAIPYSYEDKIADNLVRFFAIVSFPDHPLSLLLKITYIYRTIGELLYFIHPNKSLFLYFPDIFQILYLSVIFKNTKIYPIIIPIGIVIKLISEYVMHYQGKSPELNMKITNFKNYIENIKNKLLNSDKHNNHSNI
jgi:hypothetical protein